MQVQPASTAHAELHPSEFSELPSSQYVAPPLTLNPSPHKSLHVLAVLGPPPEHCHLASTAQDALHPSFGVEFPSSQ